MLESDLAATGAAKSFLDEASPEFSASMLAEVKPQQSIKQGPVKKIAPSSGNKKRRRRTPRLMVIYGPNEKFKEEIFSSLRDESTGTFYLPTIVTTMPQDHPGLARSSLGHKKVTVDTPTFERMVSDGGMSCYFHVFDNPAPSELGPATEGQVTSAILTTDNRDTSPERGACPVFRSHSILAMTPCSGHSNSSDVLSADSYSFPQMPVVHNLDEALLCIPEKSALEKRLITESLVHPSLGVRNSAPSSFGPEMMQSTLRNTYYFGFLDKTLHQSFQESNGVVVLLVPELAARQMYAKCSGRYPNVFVAACETRHQRSSIVNLIREEHLLITDNNLDSCKLICDAGAIVASAQRFDPIVHAEGLAYFQSRRFHLSRQATLMEGGLEPLPSPVNFPKFRLSRSLKAEKDLIEAVLTCRFSTLDPTHMRMSRTIYDILTQLGGACPEKGDHWRTIGCNADGSPRRVDGGMLTFLHVLHLLGLEGLSSLVRDIFQLSKGGKGFSFMEVASHITISCLHALFNSYIQKLVSHRQQIFGVLNDLFVGGFLKFFEMYQCGIQCPPDVKAVLLDLDAVIRQHSRRVLMSVEGHLQGFSFHAQVSQRLSNDVVLERSTSLTNVIAVARSKSSDSFSELKAYSDSANDSLDVVSGRSMPSLASSPSQSKNLSPMKFIGSAPSVFGL